MEGSRTHERVEDGLPEAIKGIFRKVEEGIIGGDFTDVQRKAAQLMARILDPPAVDAILDLPSGSVDEWMKNPKFEGRVAHEREVHERYAGPSADFGRALSPKQRAAARALTIDRKTQAEAAEAAAVDPRSIRNWLRNPSFTWYQQQLRKEHEAQEDAEREEDRRAFERRLREAEAKALEATIQAVEAGDTTAALQLLRQREATEGRNRKIAEAAKRW